MKEEWRDIIEGTFQVSNVGRVRRNKPGPRNKPKIILRQQKSHNGYMRVCLRLGTTTKIRFVHCLVAAAFIGPCPEGRQVNHKDGIKSHNEHSNLEYVTPKENSVHASVNGLKPSGDRHYIVKDRSRAPRGETLNKGHLKETEDYHLDARWYPAYPCLKTGLFHILSIERRRVPWLENLLPCGKAFVRLCWRHGKAFLRVLAHPLCRSFVSLWSCLSLFFFLSLYRTSKTGSRVYPC